jgi:hypothetical protein
MVIPCNTPMTGVVQSQESLNNFSTHTHAIKEYRVSVSLIKSVCLMHVDKIFLILSCSSSVKTPATIQL